MEPCSHRIQPRKVDFFSSGSQSGNRLTPNCVRCERAILNPFSIPEAIRQIFTGMDHLLKAPGPAWSGLIEQQAWFSRIRNGSQSADDSGASR
jgi:hypothetical protein